MTQPDKFLTDLGALAETLHKGHHALALRTADGRTLTFDGRGVSDLLRLQATEPETLRGALVADKVVGKAAAALMALGHVGALHADVISQGALRLLTTPLPPCSTATLPAHVSHTTLTDHITNRSSTGWCPLERACHDATTPEDCLRRIQDKLQEMKTTQNPTSINT